MDSYAWRIPFLLTAPLGLVGLYIRLRLTDTPALEALADSDDVATSPLREAVQTAWRPILQVIGMMIIFNVGYYVVFTYLPTYFIKTLHFSKTSAFLSITVACVVAIVLILPLAGLSDRAREAGIARLTATVSADNVAMPRLLWKMGAELTGRSRGTVDYEVALEPADEYSLDGWFRSVDDGAVLAWP